MFSATGRIALFACGALLLSAGSVTAQRPRIKIGEARVGLPPGRFVAERDASQRGAYVAKRNTWAPIYLQLEMLREHKGGAQLRIEAADADDLRTKRELSRWVDRGVKYARSLPPKS